MTDADGEVGARPLGSDLLVREGERLIVYSRADMPGWEVRKFRRTRIHFEEQPYQLARKAVQSDGVIRYLLEPWPEDCADGPVREIYYDLPYVQARDQARQASSRREARLALLPLLHPLVGLLPSGWKLRLHDRFGLHPLTATAWSVALETACILIHLMLLVLQVWTGIFNMRYLLTVLVILTPDALVRYGSLIEERMDLPGFYEWLFRLRLK